MTRPRWSSGSGPTRGRPTWSADPGTGFVPAPKLSTGADGSGWGLYLVDRIADRWGVLSDERTEVWFEIDVEPGPGGSGSRSRRRG